MNRSRHDELRRAMRRLGSFGHHDEEEAVLSLLDELTARLTRESGLALLEETKRWQRAYEDARDALAAAEARAAELERDRDEAKHQRDNFERIARECAENRHKLWLRVNELDAALGGVSSGAQEPA